MFTGFGGEGIRVVRPAKLCAAVCVSAAGLWCKVCQEVVCWDVHAACGMMLALFTCTLSDNLVVDVEFMC
jgi:hypothetical protein